MRTVAAECTEIKFRILGRFSPPPPFQARELKFANRCAENNSDYYFASYSKILLYSDCHFIIRTLSLHSANISGHIGDCNLQIGN